MGCVFEATQWCVGPAMNLKPETLHVSWSLLTAQSLCLLSRCCLERPLCDLASPSGRWSARPRGARAGHRTGLGTREPAAGPAARVRPTL